MLIIVARLVNLYEHNLLFTNISFLYSFAKFCFRCFILVMAMTSVWPSVCLSRTGPIPSRPSLSSCLDEQTWTRVIWRKAESLGQVHPTFPLYCQARQLRIEGLAACFYLELDPWISAFLGGQGPIWNSVSPDIAIRPNPLNRLSKQYALLFACQIWRQMNHATQKRRNKRSHDKAGFSSKHQAHIKQVRWVGPAGSSLGFADSGSRVCYYNSHSLISMLITIARPSQLDECLPYQTCLLT